MTNTPPDERKHAAHEKERPPTPQEWAAEQVKNSPDLTEDQIINLYRVYGIPYVPPEDS
jgi:hypothetical protein